jgi:hypothetical protein
MRRRHERGEGERGGKFDSRFFLAFQWAKGANEDIEEYGRWVVIPTEGMYSPRRSSTEAETTGKAERTEETSLLQRMYDGRVTAGKGKGEKVSRQDKVVKGEVEERRIWRGGGVFSTQHLLLGLLLGAVRLLENGEAVCERRKGWVRAWQAGEER